MFQFGFEFVQQYFVFGVGLGVLVGQFYWYYDGIGLVQFGGGVFDQWWYVVVFQQWCLQQVDVFVMQFLWIQLCGVVVYCMVGYGGGGWVGIIVVGNCGQYGCSVGDVVCYWFCSVLIEGNWDDVVVVDQVDGWFEVDDVIDCCWVDDVVVGFGIDCYVGEVGGYGYCVVVVGVVR